MNLLSVDKLSKRYGDQVLFEDITFGISKGSKVAMIAKNGTGKTSLLRIIASQESADKGEVALRNDLRVGYLDQNPNFSNFHKAIDYIFNEDDPVQRAVKSYEHCLETNDFDKLDEVSAMMDSLNAWDYEARMKQVLTKLNIHNLEQEVATLSGGQRKRLALAKLLIEEPDLYIMDEPTNHLDVDMIEWLEGYLSRQNVTLLLVTHDRYFLDRLCDTIIELDDTKIYTYNGNYHYFLEKKEERMFNDSRETDKAKNLYRKELEWVRRMPKARGTKSKSRVDAFYEIKEKAFKKNGHQELEFNIKMSRVGGKILELKNIKKSYNDQLILKGFDYTFKRGERIGIVGKNGVGKSTFLNIITGREQADSGKINAGETIVFGYYTQEGFSLKEDLRVIEVIKQIADIIPTADGGHITASQMLTAFHFPPARQHDYVSKLSGGEKRRLYLLTVLMTNPNFLVLDEPTNDLDLLTLNALEEFLMNFPGCLIVVSHDRYFMDKLVDHLFVFNGGGEVEDFNGSYIEYRQRLKDREAENAKPSKPATEKVQLKAELEKRKLTFKEKYEFDHLQDDIQKLIVEKELMESNLSSGSTSHEDLLKWASRLEEVKSQLDEKELRWLELSDLA
jgi:ATP-binding cassette subfamily F protein uup